jgi:hypothetical protein
LCVSAVLDTTFTGKNISVSRCKQSKRGKERREEKKKHVFKIEKGA